MLLSEAIRNTGILTERIVCPYCGCGDERPFFQMVDHLTHKHGWATVLIARWVAEQEMRLALASA